MSIIAIDYSIISPALTIYTDNCYTLIGFSKKASTISLPNHTIKILLKPDNLNTYSVPVLIHELLKPYLNGSPTKIILEDYAYNSFKRYQLIESTGILKHLLHTQPDAPELQHHTELTTIAPSAWKQAYLGKGTANKFESIQKLSECLGLDLLEYYRVKHLKQPPKPLQDIADSYGILQAYLQKQYKGNS